MAPIEAMINSTSKKNDIWAIEGSKVADYLRSYGRPIEATRKDGDDDDDGDYDCALAAWIERPMTMKMKMKMKMWFYSSILER